MIIAIDFDGTIVHDQFPGIGQMLPGAKETINQLKKEGYYIIIWTCRTGIRMAEAVEFLVREGVRFDKINESCPANVDLYSGCDTRKVYADLYIDDKGLQCLPSWEEIYEMVHERLPLYHDKVIQEGYL